MSPTTNVPMATCGCFPRVSGDEPYLEDGGNPDNQFSPREWG